MKTIAYVLLAAAASFCAAAQAEALRCNGDLAQVGDSKAAVLLKCGEPFFAESLCRRMDDLPLHWTRRDLGDYVPPCQVVEDWSYNPGSGQFLAILRFYDGALIAIRYGHRIP